MIQQRIITPRARNNEIIDDACSQFCITRDDFFSKGKRTAPLVSARRMVAQKLSECGLSLSEISRVMKRDHHTVRWYFSPDNVDKRRERARRYHHTTRLLQAVDPDARRIVVEVAKAEDVSPAVLIAQWVSERARYEAEAKARSVA